MLKLNRIQTDTAFTTQTTQHLKHIWEHVYQGFRRIQDISAKFIKSNRFKLFEFQFFINNGEHSLCVLL